MPHIMLYFNIPRQFRIRSKRRDCPVNQTPFQLTNPGRRTMNDFFEEFNAVKAGEVAVGVFIALVAFKLVRNIVIAATDLLM